MKKLYLIIFISANAVASFAWGPEGHHIVANIAEHYLQKNIKDSVKKYLGSMTIEEASVWMDDMRKDHSYDYMKPWHYVNIEKDKTYVKTDEPNIVNELELVINELKSKNKYTWAAINKDLKILVHLIGDLHQPLHEGYPGDRGGNDVTLSYLGKPISLHWIWDSSIIETSKITTETCLKVASKLSEADIDEFKRGSIADWVEEERMILQMVYSYDDGLIAQDYVLRCSPTIETQLLKAGVRLADILNKTFSK